MSNECNSCRHRGQCPMVLVSRNLALFFVQGREGFPEAYPHCVLLGGKPEEYSAEQLDNLKKIFYGITRSSLSSSQGSENQSPDIAFDAIKTDGLNMN